MPSTALADDGLISFRRRRRDRPPTTEVTALKLSDTPIDELLEACGRAPRQREVLAWLAANGGPALAQEVRAAVGCSASTIRALQQRGAVVGFTQPAQRPPRWVLRSQSERHRLTSEQQGGRRRHRRGHLRWRLRPVPARGRDRFRQDRGLPPLPGVGPLGGRQRPGSGARDRAHPGRVRCHRAPIRRPRRSAPFGPVRRRTLARVASRPGRRRAGGGGTQIGPVLAPQGPAADRGRRGTRLGLQAAGCPAIPRPRFGPGSRQTTRRAGGAVLGDPFGRVHSARRARPRPPPEADPAGGRRDPAGGRTGGPPGRAAGSW